MVVQELVAVLGTKIEQGDFADVFALLDKIQEIFSKVFGVIKAGLEKAFGAIDQVANLGDEIGTISEKFGIAADALQELRFAAVASDTSVEALQNGLKFLSKSAVDAAAGGKEAAAAFKGIKLKSADGEIRPVTDLLTDLADQFAELPDGAAKVDRAIQLFGKAGADLIPLLNRGADGIAELRQEAQSLGVVLSGETLAAAAEYDDAMKRLQASQQGLLNRFASPLIPKMTAIFKRLTDVLKSPGAQRAIDALSSAVSRLLMAFEGLLADIEWITASKTGMELAIFAVASAFTAMGLAALLAGASAIAAGAEMIAAWVAAAAPLLLVGALIYLIADELFTFAEGGDSVLGSLIKWFDSYDPNQLAFIRMLKAAASLIFDITSPEKWRRLGEAAYDNFVRPVADVMRMLSPFSDNIKNVIPGGATISGVAGGVSALGSLGSMLPKGSVGPALAASVLPGPVSSAMGALSSVVNVTVPPGSDAAGIAERVRTVVREEIEGQFSEALPVVGR
jgi:hypothetical protein